MYSRGEHYARQAREQYPEAERYFRDGQRAVTHRVTENPLLALVMAGIAGYVLAWLIHGESKTESAACRIMAERIADTLRTATSRAWEDP
jgi:hypothetical protein